MDLPRKPLLDRRFIIPNPACRPDDLSTTAKFAGDADQPLQINRLAIRRGKGAPGWGSKGLDWNGDGTGAFSVCGGFPRDGTRAAQQCLPFARRERRGLRDLADG